MSDGKIVAGGLPERIATNDMFEFVEEPLGPVASAIEMGPKQIGSLRLPFRWDVRPRTLLHDKPPGPVQSS